MNPITRRKLLYTGTAAVAGATGLTVAARMAQRYGLIPPDHGGLYGPGETLTSACQRILTSRTPARQFPRSMISKQPFQNDYGKLPDTYRQLQANNFADWRLTVDGLVAHPLLLSLSDLRTLGHSSQITEIACEEGWSYIAEWIGTPLSLVLREAGILPQARFLVYYSIQPRYYWDSLDMADAMHPHTLLAWGMNDGDLPIGFGGPLRIRVPRQLGYKSLKFLNRVTATDSMKPFGKGLGSASPEFGYSWYAGI